MWHRLMALCQITPPAIWGKLPAHADFVRSGVRHGEADGWARWLAGIPVPPHDPGMPLDAHRAVPVSFVLPPGALAFAPRRFVLGVIAPSVDRVGRRHPLLVYQLARRSWVMQHLAPSQPRDWLFWLARAVARHAQRSAQADMRSLHDCVQGLWQLHEEAYATRQPQSQNVQSEPHATPPLDAALGRDAERLLAARIASSGPEDITAGLHGVRYLPWSDWPQRLWAVPSAGAFWQQDERGGYLNAASRLQQLWSTVS